LENILSKNQKKKGDYWDNKQNGTKVEAKQFGFRGRRREETADRLASFRWELREEEVEPIRHRENCPQSEKVVLRRNGLKMGSQKRQTNDGGGGKEEKLLIPKTRTGEKRVVGGDRIILHREAEKFVLVAFD